MNNFKNNKLFTLGVEEEYMICDPYTGDLIDKADVIFKSIDDDYKDRFSYELLLSEIESNTSICNSSDEVIKEILFLRNYLKDIGSENDFKIGISGTHPTANPGKQNFVKNKSYKWVRNQLQYYASQNITFSTHVHVALDCPDLAIQICNILRCWIAPLLALSCNSPFFNSFNTGMQSSRTFQFGIFPRTNIAHEMSDMNEYMHILNELTNNKSIDKPQHIWWKIRPHIGFGTIEFRICDIQRSIARTKMIIAISQALVHRIYTDLKLKDIKSDYNMEFLNDALWNSASKGLDTNIINPINEKNISMKDMIYLMLDYIHPSLEYFGTTDIESTVESILNGKTEANMQIDIYNDSGFDGLKKFLIDEVEYK